MQAGEDGQRCAGPGTRSRPALTALGIAASRVLAVAAKLDLVSCLFTVFAAVFSKPPVGLDEAFAGRMSTLRRWRHNPPLGAIYASAVSITSTAFRPLSPGPQYPVAPDTPEASPWNVFPIGREYPGECPATSH